MKLEQQTILKKKFNLDFLSSMSHKVFSIKLKGLEI